MLISGAELSYSTSSLALEPVGAEAVVLEDTIPSATSWIVAAVLAVVDTKIAKNAPNIDFIVTPQD